ncbi:MAG: aspartate aminotransferase family protein [Actinobacteria bacterium]|nr:aspartate aminotransferase family protein [Actinomycetota bacterium]
MDFIGSKRAVDEGSAYVAGGVNSGYRTGLRPNPLVFTSAHGCRLTDIDGNELIDYFLGMGPMILGHSPHSVIEAAKNQLDVSLLVAGQTPLEYEAARLVTELVPSAELVRFASSGSEAVQVAFRIARAATKRMKIIKFEGHYHGWFDNVLWSVAPDIAMAGDPLKPIPVAGTEGQEPGDNLVVLPWNDAEVLEEYLKSGEIAGIIMEPIMFNTGGVLPRAGYLERVRELCDKYGTLLIFDEVITGFRVAPGGAQARLKVTPDLTILGKALANGFAVAAIVGRREFMDLVGTGRVMHGGTYNTQAISMAATVATLKEIASGSTHLAIDKTGTLLIEGLREEFTKAGIMHEVVGFPAVFNVRFDLHGPTDYRSAMKANRERYMNFSFEMLKRGVRILPRGTWFLSSAHEIKDIESTLGIVREVLNAGI